MTAHDCHDEYSARATVPAHLSLLRDALTCGTNTNERTCATNRAENRQMPIRPRKPARAAHATPLTLDQWVSRTAYVR